MAVLNNVVIGNRTVGNNQPPFIIAELSGNHNQSLERALAIFDAAAQSGAHAIKLQTYTPETLTLNSHRPEFFLPNEGNPWGGQRLWDLYTQAYTPWEWHGALFDRARSLGLACISTAFDQTSLDFLKSIGINAVKIASFELIHIPLLKAAAKSQKPLIVSTGMATASEISEAVNAVNSQTGLPPILLKATSAYPSTSENANLSVIPIMRENYGTLVGVSDHSMSVAVVATAVSLGACVIEKHLTLDRREGGPDASFSLEPDEFAEMVKIANECFEALGEDQFGPRPVEDASVWERPSVWATRDIKKGEIFTTGNIRVVRPSGGLHPRHYDELLGKRAATNISAETALQKTTLCIGL